MFLSFRTCLSLPRRGAVPVHGIAKNLLHVGVRIAALVAAVFSTGAFAQGLPPTVAAALKRAAIPATAMGTHVQEIGTGQVVMAVNSGIAFNPASTMKLLTSAAALDLLGPAYTWKTRVFATGTQNADVLEGDLIFKGGGDPKLVLENFWLLLRQLRVQGIREIRGNVVLDRTAFAEDLHDPARFDGDPAKPYNVGPDALLLSYKALTLRLVPDPASGSALVSVEPPLAGVVLAAPALSNEECGDWQAKLMLASSANRIGFGGRMPLSCGEKTWNIHPYGMTPTQYFSAVFRQMWRDAGGALQGEVRDGVLPPQARLVAERESASLPEVLRDLNKFSNNVMARQVLLTLAAEVQKVPGSPERGAHVVKNWLASRGIDNPEVIIENGAGLSRIERIAAATMARLLLAAYRAPTMPEFVSSMPLVGFDGTMKRRLQDRGVAGHAHIKTGSLSDVRAIAGYVQAISGKQYSVVSLINHVNAGRGQETQDLLLQWIYENG